MKFSAVRNPNVNGGEKWGQNGGWKRASGAVTQWIRGGYDSSSSEQVRTAAPQYSITGAWLPPGNFGCLAGNSTTSFCNGSWQSERDHRDHDLRKGSWSQEEFEMPARHSLSADLSRSSGLREEATPSQGRSDLPSATSRLSLQAGRLVLILFFPPRRPAAVCAGLLSSLKPVFRCHVRRRRV